MEYNRGHAAPDAKAADLRSSTTPFIVSELTKWLARSSFVSNYIFKLESSNKVFSGAAQMSRC